MVLWELWSVKIVLGRYIINEFVYSLFTVLYSAKVCNIRLRHQSCLLDVILVVMYYHI